MTEVSLLYNSLPTLGEADEAFTNRERVFRDLAALLARHKNIFGLCLVHAHCQLDEREIMLTEGNVSQPVQAAKVGSCYPERWLSNGDSYEFIVRETEEPPKDLADDFDRIVKIAGLRRVLGLYHINGAKDAVPTIEWTEGRKNLTRQLTQEARSAGPVQTAWDFGRRDPVTMACAIYCDTRTTRSEEPNVHRDTKTHVNVR
ncbi:hypothetical protein GGR51DRAFT_562532 [Nemania sp. FL0031]|nr:hypothetical protein GGR51DRAFT_562532 [Nemania sp. FL0031]